MKALALSSFVNKLPYIGQILLFCLATFIIAVVSIPFELLDHKTTEAAYNGTTNFLAVVVIVPIIETFIFQHLVFIVFSKLKIARNNNIPVIVTSSLLFGLTHWYSFAYIIMASSIGVVLMYAYLLYSTKPLKAFWSVVMIHVLHNLIVFALMPKP